MLFAAAAPAPGEVEAFYRERGLNLYIPTTRGGSFDVYGRFISRHLARHVPGNPNIIVRNMPGASGMQMVNFLYNTAPPFSEQRRCQRRGITQSMRF